MPDDTTPATLLRATNDGHPGKAAHRPVHGAPDHRVRLPLGTGQGSPGLLGPDLPQAQGKSLPSKEKRITISITKSSEIFLNERKVEFSLLEDTLKKIYQNRSDREIFLRADQTVPYGFVVKTMGAIKSAGIEQLGMITVPLETKG